MSTARVTISITVTYAKEFALEYLLDRINEGYALGDEVDFGDFDYDAQQVVDTVEKKFITFDPSDRVINQQQKYEGKIHD